ncbi:MAG: methyltransferase [Atopobiaceae bacterium]|nr:methyltransferase [Atopobiaceae bacterium]MBR4614638.1 SAM-dependent methyltransferase [Kiritimatiellia bacterium]
MEGIALDPCCGGKAFYFDKDSPDVLFCDNRVWSGELCDGRRYEVSPDMVADVTELPFDDRSFPLVVFDPPHLTVGDGWQVKKYGKLPRDWREWMAKAFSECWRVLAVNGTLVFKWYEYRISLEEVLKCAPCKPLFGNRRPRNSKTHWLVFFKGGGNG